MTGILYLQGGVAVVLQVLILRGLIRIGVKQYLLLTFYIISQFLGTIVIFAARLGSEGYTDSARKYFWTVEILQEFLVFLTIADFTIRLLSEQPSGARFARWLIGGSVVIVGAILLIHHRPDLNQWMTPVSRDLSFLATLLNLILWTALLRAKDGKRRMLMISGGLGIQQAGSALGHGIRLLWEIWRPFVNIGNAVLWLSYPLSLYVLYRACSTGDDTVPESSTVKQN